MIYVMYGSETSVNLTETYGEESTVFFFMKISLIVSAMTSFPLHFTTLKGLVFVYIELIVVHIRLKVKVFLLIKQYWRNEAEKEDVKEEEEPNKENDTDSDDDYFDPVPILQEDESKEKELLVNRPSEAKIETELLVNRPSDAKIDTELLVNRPSDAKIDTDTAKKGPKSSVQFNFSPIAKQDQSPFNDSRKDSNISSLKSFSNIKSKKLDTSEIISEIPEEPKKPKKTNKSENSLNNTQVQTSTLAKPESTADDDKDVILTEWRKRGLTLLVFIAIFIIANIYQDIRTIFSLLGATTSNLTGYVFPSIFFIHYGKTRLCHW